MGPRLTRRDLPGEKNGSGRCGRPFPMIIAAGPGGAIYPAPNRPDLPQLDCDRFVKGEIIHRTPEDRVLVIDVEFSGDYVLSAETAWTCRRTQDSLECRR